MITGTTGSAIKFAQMKQWMEGMDEWMRPDFASTLQRFNASTLQRFNALTL
jgi:hypothetical protein